MSTKLRVDLIRYLHDKEKMTFRAIARELGKSRTYVHRLYQEGA